MANSIIWIAWGGPRESERWKEQRFKVFEISCIFLPLAESKSPLMTLITVIVERVATERWTHDSFNISRVLASLSGMAHRRISRNSYRIFPAIVWKCQKPRVSSNFFYSRCPRLGHRKERNMQMLKGLSVRMAVHHRCSNLFKLSEVTVRRCLIVCSMTTSWLDSRKTPVLFVRFLFDFY